MSGLREMVGAGKWVRFVLVRASVADVIVCQELGKGGNGPTPGTVGAARNISGRNGGLFGQSSSWKLFSVFGNTDSLEFVDVIITGSGCWASRVRDYQCGRQNHQ
jgi:hypothetical protein